MELNLRILQLRKRQGLTQAELAVKCETTQQTVAKIEQGTVDPRLSTLQRISEALKCELVDLFYTHQGFADEVNAVVDRLQLKLNKINAVDLNFLCWEEAQIPQFHPFWQIYKIKNNKIYFQTKENL